MNKKVMRKSILAIGLSLMTLSLMAQNREIRRANRAISSGDFTEALKELNSAESQLEGAKEDVIADFYYNKAKALYGSAPNNLENIKEVIANINKVANYNAKSSTRSELATFKKQLEESLVTSAINDQNASNSISAADKLMEAYKLDEANNLHYLYYAASNYHNGDEIDKALAGYSKLLDAGYTGVEMQYFAVEVETGEKQLFSDENERSLMLRAGTHTNPTDELTKDVRPQILQYMAYIYIQKEEYENAINVVDTALQSDPENTDLLRAKADVLYQLGEKEEYNRLMQKIITLEPNNPDLFFNLAVNSAELGEVNEAIQFYDQVISLDPNHYAANLNAAILILSKDEDIVKEMNSLGMSAADNKRYDELLKKRDKLMKYAIPYLESALNIDDSDPEVRQTLKNIYLQIGEDYDYTKGINIIQLTKSGSGDTYSISGYLNGLKLTFILDTGASNVSISETEAIFMFKNGYLDEEDILGTEYYSIANGEIAEGTVINIKELKLGRFVLNDVKASVIHSLRAPILLGQSALSRLGKITINYSTDTLEIIKD